MHLETSSQSDHLGGVLTRRRMIVLLLVLVALATIALVPFGRFWVYTPLMLFGPGYLLERWLGVAVVPPLARSAVWLGLSLAVWPLLYLWATTLGLHLSGYIIFLLLLLLASLLVWQGWRGAGRISVGAGWSPMLLGGLVLLLLGAGWTRWRHIAGLAFPPWVDSVHHALLVRVMYEQGQVPYSLQPYLPIDHFTYHWGYHAIVATLMRATGLALPTAMLWIGQVLGALQVLAWAGAALALWRKPLAALVAGIVVAFVSQLPAYYLSWGRYTLLTGVLLLPTVFILARHAATSRRGLVLLALALAGLNVTHIVVFGCALLWCVVLGAGWLLQRRWRDVTALAASGTLALLLTAPWLVALVGRTVASTRGPTRLAGGEYNAITAAAPLFWISPNRWLLAAAVIGALLTLARRWWMGAALVVWSAMIMLVANPVWLGLPYLSFFNNNIIALLLFVPTSLLIAGGICVLDDAVAALLARGGQTSVRGWWAFRSLALAIVIVWQAQGFQSIINQSTVFAGADDADAIEWVQRNTPPDARFAINTDAWLYNAARGSDGGWWLLPLAGRQTSTPPVIYTYGSAAYIEQVQAITNWLRKATNQSPTELARWLREHGYTYVYATSNGRVFNATQLASAPQFRELYHNASVSIFQLTNE